MITIFQFNRSMSLCTYYIIFILLQSIHVLIILLKCILIIHVKQYAFLTHNCQEHLTLLLGIISGGFKGSRVDHVQLGPS